MHAAHLNECWQRVRSHTHAWNLDSMLIKPVQRITKYPLLFEDLLSCTTPAHPDYFAIRQAAEGARALAGDIDEAKRRKDVITSVIGKSPSTVSLIKEPKNARAGGRGLLLSRFKKDRSPMASGGPSPGDSTSAPQVISPYAQTQLSELVQRLEESESLVTRLGKEILVWREKCQIVIKNEADLNIHFLNWYTLEGKIKMDPQTAKVAAYQALISELAATVWKEMEGEVCGGTNQNSRSVMLMLGTLMDAVKNPKMIIDKLNKKSADYARYVAYASAKKSVDRPLLLEASEYVAIHTQLLEELPAFLEGYNRILEIAVAAFVGAQVRYYGAMRDRIVKYTDKFLTVPTDEQVTDRGDICEVKLDVSTFRGIHKAWIDRFREPHMMMKNLEITGGDGSEFKLARKKTDIISTYPRTAHHQLWHTSDGEHGLGQTEQRQQPPKLVRPALQRHLGTRHPSNTAPHSVAALDPFRVAQLVGCRSSPFVVASHAVRDTPRRRARHHWRRHASARDECPRRPHPPEQLQVEERQQHHVEPYLWHGKLCQPVSHQPRPAAICQAYKVADARVDVVVPGVHRGARAALVRPAAHHAHERPLVRRPRPVGHAEQGRHARARLRRHSRVAPRLAHRAQLWRTRTGHHDPPAAHVGHLRRRRRGPGRDMARLADPVRLRRSGRLQPGRLGKPPVPGPRIPPARRWRPRRVSK